MNFGCQQLFVLPLGSLAWMQVKPALEKVQTGGLHREGWCFMVWFRRCWRAMKMAEECQVTMSLKETRGRGWAWQRAALGCDRVVECPEHVQRDTVKGWTMEVLCCDLSCLGKMRKPAESARKGSDWDLEPVIGHRMAVVCEVISLLWSQWRYAGDVLRVAGSLLPTWNPAECCVFFLHCSCYSTEGHWLSPLGWDPSVHGEHWTAIRWAKIPAEGRFDLAPWWQKALELTVLFFKHDLGSRRQVLLHSNFIKFCCPKT